MARRRQSQPRRNVRVSYAPPIVRAPMRSRLVAFGALALVVASLLFGGVAPADAQEPYETVEGLRGNLKDRKDTREREDDQHIEGGSNYVPLPAGQENEKR